MPSVSIVMATYNRAHLLPRAIHSVLGQTFEDWELIIIDDGSTDETQEILSGLRDPRIKILSHCPNRGVAFARNRGLDVISGEWFTLLDSDDEIVPDALEILLDVPRRIDLSIDAVTCNCIDSVSGNFTGFGVEEDQWLDFETMVTRCYGEHWGITKTNLLGNQRFNESLPWGESVLWYRISRNAKRYYIHKGLRIYHTDTEDRLCGKKVDTEKKVLYYLELAKEQGYLDILRRYRPSEYSSVLLRIVIVHILEGRLTEARKFMNHGKSTWTWKQRLGVWTSYAMGPTILRKILPYFLRLQRNVDVI